MTKERTTENLVTLFENLLGRQLANEEKVAVTDVVTDLVDCAVETVANERFREENPDW